MTTLPLGISHNVPEEQYRSDPGLNQSLLKAFGTSKSPQHFLWEKDHPKEETDSLRIGRFVDAAVATAIGTADSFSMNDRFAVYTGAVRRGKEWEAFKEFNAGKTILNQSESERAVEAAAACAIHSDTQRILTVCARQVAVIADLPNIGRCKGLIDLLPDPKLCDPLLLAHAFDLKTAADASPEGFASACYDFGYDIQAAFYMDLLHACGVPVKNFGFIAVENKPPHLIKIHYLGRESLIIRRAQEKYTNWAIAYRECVKRDHWSGYTNSWSEITYRPWMLKDEGWQGDSLE
jgi:PDDEXK-like domain of unknown function (DUF3799)